MRRKIAKARRPKSTDEDSARYNNQKIKFYTENRTMHEQVIVSGVRPNGHHWKCICDKGMEDIITELNNMGITTLYSCVGDASANESKRKYIKIRYPRTNKLLQQAVKAIAEQYPDMLITYEPCLPWGDIVFNLYSHHQVSTQLSVIKHRTFVDAIVDNDYEYNHSDLWIV